jgi:hypothetical protein
MRAVSLVLALTACTKASEPPQLCTRALAPVPYEGTVYLLVGPVQEGVAMARLDLTSGCLKPIAPHVATESTNGRRVVTDDVSAFGTPVIDEVIDDALHPIGDKPVFGTQPAISNDGRVASVRFMAPGFRLSVWDPTTGKNTKLYSSSGDLIRPQWQDDGSILVLRGDRVRTQLVKIDPRGTAHVLTPAPGMKWMDVSSRGLVDLTDVGSTTTIYDLATGERHVLHGWYAIGWDPTGRILVVAKKDGEFGFATSPDFGSVSSVSSISPAFAIGAAWVDRPPSSSTTPT